MSELQNPVAESNSESNNSDGKAPSVPTTPSSRLYIPHSLSARGKAQVQKIDPNNGLCIVENCAEERVVDFAHVVPRRLARDKLMESVEWSWNMRLESLNLDTSRNIFRAGSSIHRLFDSSFWVLVPEKNIVNLFHSTLTPKGKGFVANRYSFPDIPIPQDNKFRYDFIPISTTMEKIAITRQNTHPTRPKPNDFTVHTYPFDTMPHLESHVHPKFALLEAGYVLDKLKWVDVKEIYEEFNILYQVSDIQVYSAWTGAVPLDAVADPTYYPPVQRLANDQLSDEDSDYTESHQSKRQKRS